MVHIIILMSVLFPSSLLAADFSWTCASKHSNNKTQLYDSAAKCLKDGKEKVSKLGCSVFESSGCESKTNASGDGTIWTCKIKTSCHGQTLGSDEKSRGNNKILKKGCYNLDEPIAVGDIGNISKTKDFCFEKFIKIIKDDDITQPGATR